MGEKISYNTWRLFLELVVDGDRLSGSVDGVTLLECRDADLDAGALGLLIEEGRVEIQRVRVGVV